MPNPSISIADFRFQIADCQGVRSQDRTYALELFRASECQEWTDHLPTNRFPLRQTGSGGPTLWLATSPAPPPPFVTELGAAAAAPPRTPVRGLYASLALLPAAPDSRPSPTT